MKHMNGSTIPFCTIRYFKLSPYRRLDYPLNSPQRYWRYSTQVNMALFELASYHFRHRSSLVGSRSYQQLLYCPSITIFMTAFSLTDPSPAIRQVCFAIIEIREHFSEMSLSQLSIFEDGNHRTACMFTTEMRASVGLALKRHPFEIYMIISNLDEVSWDILTSRLFKWLERSWKHVGMEESLKRCCPQFYRWGKMFLKEDFIVKM